MTNFNEFFLNMQKIEIVYSKLILRRVFKKYLGTFEHNICLFYNIYTSMYDQCLLDYGTTNSKQCTLLKYDLFSLKNDA